MDFKIIGYTNPLDMYPAPLVTLAKNNDVVYAIYPDCSRYEVELSDNDISDMKTFVEEKEEKIIHDGQYSFIKGKDDIITDYSNVILDEIFNIVINSNETFIENLLKNYMIDDVRSNGLNGFPIWKLAFMLSGFNSLYRVIVTNRNVNNSSGAKANRLILQLRSSSGYKTHYKKNMHSTNLFKECETKRVCQSLEKVTLSILDKFSISIPLTNNN